MADPEGVTCHGFLASYEETIRDYLVFFIISLTKSPIWHWSLMPILVSSCSWLLLPWSSLLQNPRRIVNIRHARWTAQESKGNMTGSPQTKYKTYTWFLDLGIDSKAFRFHCWLVMVCFTWGKETIVVISLWSPAWTLCSGLSVLPPCILTFPKNTIGTKYWVPNSSAHLSYNVRLATWSLLVHFPTCEMGLKYLLHWAVAMITRDITCKVFKIVSGIWWILTTC